MHIMLFMGSGRLFQKRCPILARRHEYPDALVLRPDAGDVSFAPWVFGYRYHSVSTGVRITRLRVGTRRRMYLDSRQYEVVITNMDIEVVMKLIEVNKWRTTHKCFSSQACSGLDCRRNQSSIA